ncbi:hypothetical protein ACFRCX_30820 [Streptomyces sp. NPDC056652]|uniref:hypothetical protein n=1 Tax=Streptomyces sp. NPDC056652 TaxID=3345893 RepID=UPI0036CF77DC
MPYVDTSCQLPRARTSNSRQKSPTPGGIPGQKTGTRTAPSATHGQDIATTPARRSSPRKWLRAVVWLINAGLHPKANATTLRVAQDLAARMDYDTGHVRYCMDETIARTGVSRASLKRHVSYLRDLGALAWAVHGTKANIRTVLGLGGYAGTATVYAATIPAAYDEAMGHTVIGSGYEARIVIDQRCQAPAAQAPAPAPVDNPPVDNPSSGSCEPPSLTLDKEEGQVQMVGGFNYTSRKRASRSTTSPSPHQTKTSNSSEDGARRRTPAQVASEIRETRLVRALVNWTQGERSLRRLTYVLRPYFDRGLRAHDIAAELNGTVQGWRPKHPAAFIRTTLGAQAAQEAALAADEARRNDATWRQTAADMESLRNLFCPQGPEPERTDEDRLRARLDWSIWSEVAAHYAEDPDDALDLYGTRLCSYAEGQDARRNQPTYA